MRAFDRDPGWRVDRRGDRSIRLPLVPLSVASDLAADQYGLSGETFEAVELSSEGEGRKWSAPRTFRRDVSLPPRTACAWQLSGR